MSSKTTCGKLGRTIHNLLIKNKKTLSIAESCTGGLVSSTLTNYSGSSQYLKLAVIAYSNQAKTEILGINPGFLEKYGAVSKETALLMAKKVRLILNTDFGVSTTGIAGPEGATKDKPIGTVYIGLSSLKKSFTKKFEFKGTRIQIKNKAKNKVLELLKKCLIPN